MSPVFSAKLIPKWSTPIDFGAMHKDGRRVLGAGKTWRGLVVGGLIAGVTAVLMAIWPIWVLPELDFGLATGNQLYAIFLFGFLMGFMALVGDAVESFFKRRRNLKRGAPWFPFDQLDFIVFGLAAVFLFHPLLGGDWALNNYLSGWVIGTVLIGTPILHLLVNRLGYWLKLKDVPW